MASSTAPTSQDTHDCLSATARILVAGLGWSALMLFVLGFWLRAKYGATLQSNIVMIAALGAAGLALWQAFTLWYQKTTPDRAAALTQQRRIFSYVLLAGGAALVIFAFVLGNETRRTAAAGGSSFIAMTNFAEFSSVLIFGLIALGCGYYLMQPLGGPAVSPVQFLAKKVPLMKFVLIVLGVFALGTMGYIVVNKPAQPAPLPGMKELGDAASNANYYLRFIPELLGLLAFSILCFACVLWINVGEMDDVTVRLFVLVFGGSSGLILFLYSLIRAITWRQDIFLGGIAAWQGDNAWHFWLCAYLQFIALIVMFGSLSLARADIRQNVVLRRVVYGYDTAVQALLLVEILAVLNVVIYAMMPFTFDWTKSRGVYALSDSTVNLISKLNKELNVVVLMPKNDQDYRDLHNFMDNCRALSNKFIVKYVSPDADPTKYNFLAEQFPKIQIDTQFGRAGRGGVLMVNGPMPETEKHNSSYAFVPASKLSSMDHSDRRSQKGKSKRVFKGELEVVKEMKFLVQGQKKRNIYVLQGHGEPDINMEDPWVRRAYHGDMNKLGFGAFADRLKKDNQEVFGLSFGKELPGGDKSANQIKYAAEGSDKKKDIPKDCETLIVSPTAKPLPAEEVEAIERYLERGGTMLVFLDILVDDDYTKIRNIGIEPLLKRYGVDVTDSFPLEVRDAPSTLIAMAAVKSEHVLAKQFFGRAFQMPNLARILKTTEAPGGRFKAEAVLQLDPRRTQDKFQIVESNVGILKRDLDNYLEELDRRGLLRQKILANLEPITVAVAVTETRDKEEKPRIVVVGDTEFLNNADLTRSRTGSLGYAFAASALEWLAEREAIGALPKENEVYTLGAGVNVARMVLLPGWIMFLTLIALGGGIWLVRRR